MSENPNAPELLSVHRALLERWRKVMNLVGPGDLQTHYDDCERALDGLQPEGRWADLGTGAGFPGVPFAATFPEVEVHLVDSRLKRCRFLDEVVAEAGVEHVRVRRMRHEDLEPAHFDGIMSRALHAPPRMLEVARRLLKPGGQLVLFLQDDADVPTGADFAVLYDRTYRVAGKARKSVVLQKTCRSTPTDH